MGTTKKSRALILWERSDGTVTRAAWAELKRKYGGCCAYCGRKTVLLEKDHITPISKGGQHTISNIVPACKPCNTRKHDKTPDEAGMVVMKPEDLG
jgi:5-methylcytosine-specific restriction endonuclease McrA